MSFHRLRNIYLNYTTCFDLKGPSSQTRGVKVALQVTHFFLHLLQIIKVRIYTFLMLKCFYVYL
jgi:hypothetical protein